MTHRTVRFSFIWLSMKVSRIALCDYRQRPTAPFNDKDFWMKPYEYVILKVLPDGNETQEKK